MESKTIIFMIQLIKIPFSSTIYKRDFKILDLLHIFCIMAMSDFNFKGLYFQF